MSSQQVRLACHLQCVLGCYPHPECSVPLGRRLRCEVGLPDGIGPRDSKIDLDVDPLGSAVLPPGHLDQSNLSVNPWDSRFWAGPQAPLEEGVPASTLP